MRDKTERPPKGGFAVCICASDPSWRSRPRISRLDSRVETGKLICDGLSLRQFGSEIFPSALLRSYVCKGSGEVGAEIAYLGCDAVENCVEISASCGHENILSVLESEDDSHNLRGKDEEKENGVHRSSG